jgi:AAA domain, putative AbiEii toxin, Type IV TA system
MFKSLRLERFKNFKDAEIKLGPFTVLIGANASGKSNIRDAFRFLHGVGRGYNLTEIIGEKISEGGEKVWSGVRGGAREVAFSGHSSFALTCESTFPPETLCFGVVEISGEGTLRYQIMVEVSQRSLTPRVVWESLWVVDHGQVFSAKAKDRKTQSVMMIYSPGNSKPEGPLFFPITSPVLGQTIHEVRNSIVGSTCWWSSESQSLHLGDIILELSQAYDEPLGFIALAGSLNGPSTRFASRVCRAKMS